MPLEQHTEGIGVTVDVPSQQFLVGRPAVVRAASRGWPLVGRLAWLRQGVAPWRLLVRFRRFLPPPWWSTTPQDSFRSPPRPRDPMIVNGQETPWITTPKICAMYLLPA